MIYEAAYQGQPGAYSEQAARRICGEDARLLPGETLVDAFTAVTDGRATSAVVPIENSLVGAVPGALNLLLGSGLVVHAEVSEWIDHVLAAPAGATLGAVREVLSHPVALAQCTGFFREHPAIRAVPVFDTAGALQMVMERGDPSRAAIAGRLAAALYGAAIVEEHLQDHPANYTRFIQVAHPPLSPIAEGPFRLMLSVRLAHRPGTLARTLQSLAAVGINLTRIDSAPVPGRAFEYKFLLEGITAGRDDVDVAIAELGSDAIVRVIGRFGAGRPVSNSLTAP